MFLQFLLFFSLIPLFSSDLSPFFLLSLFLSFMLFLSFPLLLFLFKLCHDYLPLHLMTCLQDFRFILNFFEPVLKHFIVYHTLLLSLFLLFCCLLLHCKTDEIIFVLLLHTETMPSTFVLEVVEGRSKDSCFLIFLLHWIKVFQDITDN